MNSFWLFVGVSAAFLFYGIVFASVLASVLEKAHLPPRECRGPLAAFAAVLTLYAGAKHATIQVVDRPDWLTYSIAYVDETPKKATFTFSSPKQIPPDTVIDFAVAIGGGATTNWIDRPSALYGLGKYELSTADLTPSHVTNYLVRITSDYVPSDTYIHDFAAIASKTNLAVTCDFNCSTNLVGAPGVIQHRDLVRTMTDFGTIINEAPWQTDYSFTAQKDNHITIIGNFVSRGTDREFRVVVSNEVLNVWRFSR